MNTTRILAPRLLAGFGTAALVAGVGLFASSRPAHTAGGPIPVTVSNTVQNRDADSPVRHPVEGYIHLSLPSSYSYDNLVYTVPAGKELVVESMTLFNNDLDNTVGDTAVVNNNAPDGSNVSFASLSAPAYTGAFASTTQPVRLHVGPGGSVSVNVFATGNNTINVLVSLSGYLVDAP